MSQPKIQFKMRARQDERDKASAYVADLDHDLLMTSFEEVPAEVDRLVAEAFIAGARSQSATLADREAKKQSVIDALHADGYGTYTYDNVPIDHTVDIIFDALGYDR